MIKTIFFDLGNVLLFFSHPKMFQQISDCTGIEENEIRRILMKEKIQEYYETGQIDTAHVYDIFQSRSKKPFSLPSFLDAASDIFTPNLSLFSLVEKIKEKKIRLILLSNTSECHFNYAYAKYPILKLFNEYILSYQVGALKPSEKIFLKALAAADCDPKHCFYTDDIPEFIDGARRVGLDGAPFTHVSSLKSALAARGLEL